MRVPVTSQSQQQAPQVQNPTVLKPVSCYEPTSVLEIRSPAASDKPASLPDNISPNPDPSLPRPDDGAWEDHAFHTLDWDSIMKDLGLPDDPAPAFRINSQLSPSDQFASSHHHHTHHLDSAQFLPPSDFPLPDAYSATTNGNPTGLGHGPGPFDSCGPDFHGFSNFGLDFVEELVQAADCFDSSELQLAQVILARLNQRLRSPAGKPLQRAAFYFREALQSLLSSPNRSSSPARLSSWPDIVQTIGAYKAFSGVSPISMFTHFTSNQTLLESLDGSMFFHVVDFDIGFGGQYASFMKEIAERVESCKVQPPIVRITAIVPEEFSTETKLIRENLFQFAHELKLRLEIEFVLIRAFEVLSFKSVKFMEGENLAVHLSSAIFHRLGSANNATRFLDEIRRLNPSIVVFVDTEPWGDAGGATSFRRSFFNCLEYYTMLFESVDAAIGGGGGSGSDWGRKIEAYLLKPRIAAAVEAAARRGTPPWREAFHRAGMRAVRQSQFADYQAECLLGKVQVMGFHVAKRQAELVLCWHERPLVATSAWKF